MHKVSIIVPAYNVENYVAKCLNSLQKQTYEKIEIVIVNDGSTDKTTEIVKTFAQKEKRTRLIQQTNQGHGPSCNRGMVIASGTYLMFCDADDYYAPTMVEKMINAIKTLNTPVVTASAYAFDDKTNLPITQYNHNALNNLAHKKSSIDDQEIITIADQIPIQYWSKIYQKSWLQTNQIVFPQIKSAYDDIPFHWQTLCRIKQLGIVDEPLYYYRCNRKGSSFDTINSTQFVLMHQYAIKQVAALNHRLLTACISSYIDAIGWLFAQKKRSEQTKNEQVSQVLAQISKYKQIQLMPKFYQVLKPHHPITKGINIFSKLWWTMKNE